MITPTLKKRLERIEWLISKSDPIARISLDGRVKALELAMKEVRDFYAGNKNECSRFRGCAPTPKFVIDWPAVAEQYSKWAAVVRSEDFKKIQELVEAQLGDRK